MRHYLFYIFGLIDMVDTQSVNNDCNYIHNLSMDHAAYVRLLILTLFFDGRFVGHSSGESQ